MHINVLELTSIKFAIFSLMLLQVGMKNLRVMIDNGTGISYINRQGEVRSTLYDNVATEIWDFCVKRGVYTSAAHVPGKENIIAGLASREFEDSHECMLYLEEFKYLVESFPVLDIDMFASRLNKQLPKYASWMLDPESYIIDRMSASWENTYIYVFLQFNMICPTINKIEKETEKTLIIVSMWPIHTWFVLQMVDGLREKFKCI